MNDITVCLITNFIIKGTEIPLIAYTESYHQGMCDSPIIHHDSVNVPAHMFNETLLSSTLQLHFRTFGCYAKERSIYSCH